MADDSPRTEWDDDDLDGQILFEIVAMGNAVKVSAVDPVTNTEVSVIGSPRMSPFTLKTNAMRKLMRALRMRSEAPPPAPKRRRRGVWA